MRIWKFALLLSSCVILSIASTSARAVDQPKIATVDAGIGSCKADFTVKDGSGKPIYNSKIDVFIRYGFMNMRQTSLEAYTNPDGQARFTGLPNFPKKPLEFTILSGTVSKTVTDDPTANCNASFNVTLTIH
jgi:hypothetical protein